MHSQHLDLAIPKHFLFTQIVSNVIFETFPPIYAAMAIASVLEPIKY